MKPVSEREPFHAYLRTHVGHPGGQEVVHRVAAGVGERGGDVGVEAVGVLLDQLGEDHEKATAPPTALGQLRRGTHDRFDDRIDIDRAS